MGPETDAAPMAARVAIAESFGRQEGTPGEVAAGRILTRTAGLSWVLDKLCPGAGHVGTPLM